MMKMIKAKERRVMRIGRKRRESRRNQGVKLRSKQVAEEVVVEELEVKLEKEEENIVEGGKCEVEGGEGNGVEHVTEDEVIDIGREIVDTTSLLSELFRDIQSTKAARETVRNTHLPPPSLSLSLPKQNASIHVKRGTRNDHPLLLVPRTARRFDHRNSIVDI